MSQIKEIPVLQIKEGEHSLRATHDDEEIAELSRSIGRVGVISPLVVADTPDGYCLIAGHRRLAAARKAGLGQVPCILRDDEESVVKEVAFAENLFRKDLSPVEVASSIADIFNAGTMGVQALAAALHRSEHWVRNQVVMLNWPQDVLALVHSGVISVAAASNLALITEDVYRGFLIDHAVQNGATARVTAAWLQAWRAEVPPAAAAEAEPAESGPYNTPLGPQAPCLVCNEVKRQDQLAMIMVCPSCISAIRGVVQT